MGQDEQSVRDKDLSRKRYSTCSDCNCEVDYPEYGIWIHVTRERPVLIVVTAEAIVVAAAESKGNDEGTYT